MRRNLWRDTSGIAYVWAMFAILIVLGAVLYFPMSYVWDKVYTTITGDYVFTGDTALGIAAINLVMSYLMAFVVIFGINWVIVNSKSEAYEQ